MLVRIACERLSDSDELFVGLSAPPFELPDEIASETTKLDCLLAPDSQHSSGKALAGTDMLSGKSAFRIGYILPDEQAAARAVELVRKFYLGQSRGLTRGDRILSLFMLRRRLGDDADGKPVFQYVHGSIGWSVKTAPREHVEVKRQPTGAEPDRRAVEARLPSGGDFAQLTREGWQLWQEGRMG